MNCMGGMNRSVRRSTRALLCVTGLAGVGSGCATPCLDDGLLQQACPEEMADATGSATDATESATASASATESAGDASGGVTQSDTDSAGDASAGDASAGDATAGDDDGEPTCAGEGGKPFDPEYKFSMIWIANSPEGTVSKIDTVTAVERSRYGTGPGSPDPSRTAVNLRGDVAVANRAGSITKIAGHISNCVDKNENGVIDTSLDPDDVLDWGTDECVLWHHEIEDFPSGLPSNQGGPRAIAWEGGVSACDQPRLWVGWRAQPDEVVHIRRLDGVTGDTLDEVEVEDWTQVWGHGTYGGVSDAHGGLWALGTGGTLLHVGADMAVQRWDNPVAPTLYSLALDADGVPWLAGYAGNLWRFDPVAQEFQDMGAAAESSRLRGIAVDDEGHAWIAGNNPCGLARYDTVTETIIDDAIPIADCEEPVGVSVDAEGNVWVVDRGASVAFKVDRNDYSSQTVEGLNSPYTYSDMTGTGLKLLFN
jgi:hypothetical protein